MPEWLEADGVGSYASGTADTIRTRRYHALLLVQSPIGRLVLVNGFEAWIDLPTGGTPLASQRYAPDTVHPDGATRIVAFTIDPWPTWTYTLPDGSSLTQEIFSAGAQTNLRWTRTAPRLGNDAPATLHFRPLLSGRDYHSLQHENPAFDFSFEQPPTLAWTRWRPYPGLPAITAWGGAYRHDPQWYRNFLYTEERDRGLDHIEDLASPGILSWDLARPATLAFRADTAQAWPVPLLADALANERKPLPPLHRAARHYIAHLGSRATILAGFPWFTDWGRDTFISLRGLLLAPPPPASTPREKLTQATQTAARRDLAEKILLAWSTHVDQGMLPNRFPDAAGLPEYNAVDASLWFVVAVHDLLLTATSPGATARLQQACRAILEGYAAGTRYGIGATEDGLLHAGEPGVQLTWMDAKVGDWVVTPRIGKPVEVQALWINALRIAARWPGGERWFPLAETATAAFLARFPDPETGGLYDVLDGDPVEKTRIRPNQILAVGGLPYAIVPPSLAASIVSLVETRLLTPLGLRTLDPADPAYCPTYAGTRLQRDAAYHQGTAWPWLLGPFVSAWLRVHGDTTATRAEARTRFLAPLYEQLHHFGLGHLPEVADGSLPHRPGGCPFQAWSLGELLRIESMLAEPST